MAVEIRKYTIDRERMKRGVPIGFTMESDGLVLDNRGDGGVFFSGRFDSTVSLNEWGRLRLFMTLPEQCSYSLSVYVSNENTISLDNRDVTVDRFLRGDSADLSQKMALFAGKGLPCCKNLSDMLLYGTQGRYLWFAIEMYSPDRCVVTGGELFTPGDAFEEYLPQIYQTGDFFRRYMSVMSSMYLDLERQVERYPNRLDPETATEEMLPILAEWIGLSEICKFVSGEVLRSFLREGFWLNRHRGTVQCISRVVELFTRQHPIVVERYRFFEQPSPYTQLFSKLYGEDDRCFTVLLFDEPEQQDALRLQYLIRLFAPLKTTARIVSVQEMIFLDSCLYLDKNARLVGRAEGVLESSQEMDTNVVFR